VFVGGAELVFELVEEGEQAAAVEFVADSRGNEGADVLAGHGTQIAGEFVGDADGNLGHVFDPAQVGTFAPHR
jgi:hypothetical protein